MAKNGESAYTPAVALIAALGAALDWIAAQAATAENPAGSIAEGRKMLTENAETIAAMTRAAVQALGMSLFAPDAPSAAATAVLPPAGVDSGVIVKELKSRFGAIITNGQGEMKGQIFRIAHLGFFDYMDTIALIGALEQVAVKSFPNSGFRDDCEVWGWLDCGADGVCGKIENGSCRGKLPLRADGPVLLDAEPGVCQQVEDLRSPRFERRSAGRIDHGSRTKRQAPSPANRLATDRGR